MADSGVDQFCAVTGSSKERAQFYLEAAGGNLQAAIDAFFNQETTNVSHKTVCLVLINYMGVVFNNRPHLLSQVIVDLHKLKRRGTSDIETTLLLILCVILVFY